MNIAVALSKQHKDLLHYILDNPDKTLSKESLIENVWKGRIVAGNTIDQSLSKLKKILNDCQSNMYFETVYGQGIKFLPEVNTSQVKLSNTKLVVMFILPGLLILLYVLHAYFSPSTAKEDGVNKHNKQILLMVLPQLPQRRDPDNDKTWLNDSSWKMFEQLINYSDFAQLKAHNKKPANLNNQQYLDYLWGVSHDLNTLSVNLSEVDNMYTLSLELTNNKQVKSFYKGSDEKLNTIFLLALQWLNQQFNHTITSKNLLPENSYLLELYLRGLSGLSHDNLRKASHFFELDISDSPEFHLARLELVKIRLIQGKAKQALTLLEAINFKNPPAKFSIEMARLRSQAYMLDKNTKQAIEALKNTIIQFTASEFMEIHELRFKLSAIHLNLKQYDLALNQLNNISIDGSGNPELTVKVLQQQALIYLNNKRTQEAKDIALEALEIHHKIGNSSALAKTHQLLAKIAIQQYDYKFVETNLVQSLSIYRSLTPYSENNLDIVENLTELISVLIEQGKLAKAKKINSQLQQRAQAYHITSLLIDSETYTIIMAIMQRKWLIANQHLQKQKVLATKTNNHIALIKNQLLSIELLLAQNIVTGVKTQILKLQNDIDKTEGKTLLLRTNILLARLYLLGKKTKKGITLLISAKTFAQSLQDNRAIVKINNILAQHYLDDKQSNKAMKVLQESVDFNPSSYPYLLLKSKANMQSGKNMKALELAIELKTKFSQLWSAKDEEYLKTLIQKNKSR